jgi:glutamate dehydrogenase
MLHTGGVTSSSLEVLAGLALSTEEYVDLMLFKDGKPSEFYQSYVKDIQAKISENAAAEFSCIWREHQRVQGEKARTTISDELSITLNNLQTELEGSDLFDDLPSRRGVLSRAIPQTLVEKVGLDTLIERIPMPHQRALFSSWVSSHFVSSPARTRVLPPKWRATLLIPRDDRCCFQIYRYGVQASSVDFFHFARDLGR